MEYVGLNKKLYERRLELDYSVLEACIRLDISKTHLYLIEHGYIKVKDPKLQARFIKKYKLEEDFFNQCPLEYPTPIEPPEKEKKITKFGKFIASWPFKVGCLAILCGFVAMTVSGLSMSPRITKDVASFYNDDFNRVKEVARNSGTHHNSIDADISYLLSEDFYSLESFTEHAPIGNWHTAVSFLGEKNIDEFLPYTFYSGITTITDEVFGFGDFYLTFEARYLENLLRIQFNAYEYDFTTDLIGDRLAHISADYNKNAQQFTYNLVESIKFPYIITTIETVEKTSFEYMFFTSMFERQSEVFEKKLPLLFEEHFNETGGVTFVHFNEACKTGLKNYNSFSSLVSEMIIWGLVLSAVFLAILAFSFIKSAINKVQSKVLDASSGDDSSNTNNIDEIARKPLPKNNWPTPFIPEMVIRILVLVVSFMSSIGIFYIFQAIQGFDPIGLVNSISFKAEIASFATMSMILFFFTKLDIFQSKKNTFLINYILFFLGLIFYFLLIIIQFALSNSNSSIAQTAQQFLPYLPGNIVWGILAFNLLSTILFSKPKFKNDSKKKMILYRSLIILPLGYMLVSCIYQIGNKAAGWVWPFAVTSLLFNKALIITSFTVCYCLVVFLYKLYVSKKYGESSDIYQNGNRYFFIKNFLICLVLAALGIIDLVIGKTMGANNPLGAGGNYVILFAIPFVLLYHPHMGQRNAKWDIAFAGLYALSMVIGILLIANNLSVYISSL